MRNKIEGIKGIIFDFDFTLADSSKGVVECVNYAMKELGFSKFAERQIYKTIGLTLEHTFIELVGKDNLEKTEEFRFLFIKRADEIMADYTTMLPDTPSVIEKLYEKKIKLGIVSTKFRYRIETILSRENLLKFFEVVIGGEDVSNLKPDPTGLLLAIKRLNLNPLEAIYVGDSITDAQTADRAGISFIAVLAGVTSREDFLRFHVNNFLNDISELPRVLSIK